MHTQTFLTLRARLILLATLLAVPFTALAVPPPVTGIEAVEENSQVHVRWQKLPDEENIAYYRVFFSSQSILGNGGLYEDFDVADGSASEHVFANAPAVPTLYISVLAVNDRGEESASFLEEASVNRSVVSVTDVGAATSSQANPEPQVSPSLTLLGVETRSSTGILLTFSEAVDVRDEDADAAFTIVDGSGAALAVTHLVIAGNTVTLETDPQEPGKVYQLGIQNVFAVRADGVRLTLDPSQSIVLFAGFADPAAPTPGQPAPQPQPATTPPPAADLVVRLHAEAQGNDRYVLEATWEGGAQAAMMYLVSQTTDHGMTFSEPQVVPGAMRGVRIGGVPSGELGVRVQESRPDGSISDGTIAFIRLGDGSPLPAHVIPPASVRTVPTQSGNLSRTGLSMTAVIALAGAGAGVAAMRRRVARA